MYIVPSSVTLTILLLAWSFSGFVILWIFNESYFVTFCLGAFISELLLVWIIPNLTIRVSSWLICGILSIMFTPKSIELLLFSLVTYSLPLLALCQIVWIVSSAILLSKTLITYSDDYPQIVLWIFGGLTGLCFTTIASVIWTAIDSSISPQSASALSVLVVCAFLACASGIVLEIGIAIPLWISTFSLFCAKLAMKSSQSDAIVTFEANRFYELPWMVQILIIFLGPPGAPSLQNNLYYGNSLSFSFDFIISQAITVLTVLSIPFLMSYDFDEVFTRTYKPIEKDQTATGNSRKSRMFFYALAILLYMHLILDLCGVYTSLEYNSTNFMSGIRWMEAFGCIVMYTVAVFTIREQILPNY